MSNHYFGLGRIEKETIPDIAILEKSHHAADPHYGQYDIRNIQSYYPLYDVLFPGQDNSTVGLNHSYRVRDLQSIKKTELPDETRKERVHIKYAPLLDPIKYMIGRYDRCSEMSKELPQSGRTGSNMYHDVNNFSYVDTFFCFLTNQLKSYHGLVNGISFYGSFLGVQKRFRVDISDELSYLNDSQAFFNKLKNGEIDCEEFSSYYADNEGGERLITGNTRGNKRRLVVEDAGVSLDDEIVDIDVESDNPSVLDQSVNPYVLVEEQEEGQEQQGLYQLMTIAPESFDSADELKAPPISIESLPPVTNSQEGSVSEDFGLSAEDLASSEELAPSEDLIFTEGLMLVSPSEGLVSPCEQGLVSPSQGLELVYEDTRNYDSDTDDCSSDSCVRLTDDENDSVDSEYKRNRDISRQLIPRLKKDSESEEEDEDSNEDSADSEEEWEDIESDEDDNSNSSSETSSNSSSEPPPTYAYLIDFPIQMIFQEKCDGTLDSLFDESKMNCEIAMASMLQVVMTLIAYQRAFGFTHNDLHTNNIMYVNTDVETLYYRVDGKEYAVPTYGRIMKIIDFGRAIYSFGGRLFTSNCFDKEGDAYSQYNCEPYYNPKKPRIEPNYAFDLCRLATSIFDFVMDEDFLLRGKEGDQKRDEMDRFQKLIFLWCQDDEGRNVLYNSKGDERYKGFSLYKMIARSVHRHKPLEQLPYFAEFLYEKASDNDETHLPWIDLDSLPVLSN